MSGFHLSHRFVLFIAVGILLLALLLGVMGKRGLDFAERTKSWPSVPAALGKVERIEHYDEEYGTRYTFRHFIYYHVDQEKFETTLSSRTRLKSPFIVYYNSAKPKQFVREPGVPADGTYLAFGGAIFCALFGMVVFLITLCPSDSD